MKAFRTIQPVTSALRHFSVFKDPDASIINEFVKAVQSRNLNAFQLCIKHPRFNGENKSTLLESVERIIESEKKFEPSSPGLFEENMKALDAMAAITKQAQALPTLTSGALKL